MKLSLHVSYMLLNGGNLNFWTAKSTYNRSLILKERGVAMYGHIHNFMGFTMFTYIIFYI